MRLFGFGRSDGDGDGESRSAAAIVAFATGLSVATVALVWLAWAANAEMRRSTALLLERRASEVLALTSAALNRDMKGAWLSALAPMDAADLREDPPYDFLQLTSRVFAHFPYPESFLIWTADGSAEGRSYAFNRADRSIPWDAADRPADPYPVTLVPQPAALAPLVARIREQAAGGRRFALIETTLAGVPYHVVVHRFTGAPDGTLNGFAAFTVNLDWIRREYFGELLRQVATINGDRDAMSIAVFDSAGRLVATSGSEGGGDPVRQRSFPLIFVEPGLVTDAPPALSGIAQWTAQVQPSAAAAAAAFELSTQMLLIATLAGGASLVAVLLTARAVRVRAGLAAMKSDFVSAVTHELKTPLALIKLVADTLERGRYTSPDTIREYAAMLSQEERRLSHLIENLLTYARASDLRQMYTYESVDLSETIDDTLQPFHPRLDDLHFALTVDVDPHLPRVKGDRAALVQVFANLIDNAIKYSPDEPRRLAIEAAVAGRDVRVRFADSGQGISAEELPRVTDKFYRGRDARTFGSGLGLTIVRRIVHQHGGRVDLQSQPGTGTTITVTLPAA